MKTCKRCNKKFKLTSFYRHKAMKDGYLNFCKKCTRNRICEHRKQNIEYIRKYDRERGLLTHRKLLAKKTYKRLRESGKSKIYSKNWSQKNKKKRRAHSIFWHYGIRSGKIKKQPCEKCGSFKVHAHHDNYSKPLEVRWLCYKHHAEHHRAERELGRGNYE